MLIAVQRLYVQVLVFFCRGSRTNSNMVFNTMLPQLRALMGPVQGPRVRVAIFAEETKLEYCST